MNLTRQKTAPSSRSWSCRPVTHRFPNLRGPALAVALVCPAASFAQTISYQLGYSTSWGENSVILCRLTCATSDVSSARNLYAPAGGAALSVRIAGPWRLETGALLLGKGWAVTAPTLRTLFLEIPALVYLGGLPDTPGVRYSVGGGAALDLGVSESRHSHGTLLVGGQLHSMTARRSIWSLGLRYSRSMSELYGFHVHGIAVILSHTPARRRPG
jgi:hypothetical protein